MARHNDQPPRFERIEKGGYQPQPYDGLREGYQPHATAVPASAPALPPLPSSGSATVLPSGGGVASGGGASGSRER